MILERLTVVAGVVGVLSGCSAAADPIVWQQGSPVAVAAPSPAAAPAGAPTRVRIPRIGVDVALVSLALDARGVLQTPDYPVAGWYGAGTSPGDIGPAVIVGHVDSKTGPAAFYRLHELADGDAVEVTRGDTVVTFRVSSTAWYPKNRFPTATVYGPTTDAQLRLITCGGDFDRSKRSYVDNLVVYAVSA